MFFIFLFFIFVVIMLELYHTYGVVEAGCDEAGRGCLAGPVVAAAVVLPEGFKNDLLNDSKKLTKRQREELRVIIEREAVAWAVAYCDNNEIDTMNILNASIFAMQKALDMLSVVPEHIIVDGNRFKAYKDIPYDCIVKGDGKYMSIAAASVLAKTHRDEYMCKMHDKYPQYNWKKNMGYPTKDHRKAIEEYGACDLHRVSFRLIDTQLKLF